METRKNNGRNSKTLLMSTLPIRNGNFSDCMFPPLQVACEYLTYKEWKLYPPQVYYIPQLSEYLTYKEWKQNISFHTLSPY